MNKLRVLDVGCALGWTLASLSIICAILFMLLPDFMIIFSNSLFHGIDVTSLARESFSISSAIFGVIISWIIGMFVGSLFVLFYNSIIDRGRK